MNHRKDPESRRKRDIGVSRRQLILIGMLLSVTVAALLLYIYVTGKVR